MTVLETGVPTVLHLSGDIDIFTTAALRRQILGALDGSTGSLVLDMSAVTFCGAGGLGVLLHAQRRARAIGVALTLTGVTPRMARLLFITGLEGRFTVLA
ncbi:STAS domain-containing protein [Herbidospora cretacea]|uniref:STAS domain-containing protein n=1 Tax=Herbidospora cretacea TaxID=28444 RepID=UPI00077498CE|nr:STAS domain-containing protein [Herbidospora cretacea]